jgi:hypothetical protein
VWASGLIGSIVATLFGIAWSVQSLSSTGTIEIIKTATASGENLGENPAFSVQLYNLIKCQRSDIHDCAMYKELRCMIPATESKPDHLCGKYDEAVTLLCGHTFCRECIRPFYGQRCPCYHTTQCNYVLNVPINSIKKNIAVYNIVTSLI